MQSIEIPTARTVIRPFSAGDAGEVFACISLEITRLMAWEPPPTEDAFADIWRTWLSSIEQNSELYLVPHQRVDGRCLGIIGVHDLNSETPELGIWLRHDVHGLKLGRELIGAVARWLSQNYPIKYFEYPVAEENIASRRIAEAHGGQIKGHRTNPKYSSVVYHIPPPPSESTTYSGGIGRKSS